MSQIELGLDTFGDLTAGPGGRPNHPAQVLRDVLSEAELADRLGVDFIGLGEHHRPDFAISAPEVVLAAIAGRTNRIRLGTAVTVLSTDDPVRVYERFSTLNAVSNGRAEVILGRGSFTESFPLFGYSLDDYERLFGLAREKLEPGAVVVADNVLSHQETLGAYTHARQADATLESVTLPLDRGLEVSVVLTQSLK